MSIIRLSQGVITVLIENIYFCQCFFLNIYGQKDLKNKIFYMSSVDEFVPLLITDIGEYR